MKSFEGLIRGTFADLNLAIAKTHGMPESEVTVPEGVALPEFLVTYYRLVGHHPVNQDHDRLLEPSEVELRDDMVVFMYENQEVCCWGVRSSEAYEADPLVWQGHEGGWYPEGLRLSEFLLRRLRWTQKNSGSSEPADTA